MPKKNAAAVTLGKQRWAGVDEASRKEQMAAIAKRRKKGQASRAAASITPEAARKRALKAAETRRKNRCTNQQP